jgi:probable H4MPT-linked C1 transfer pathway protein
MVETSSAGTASPVLGLDIGGANLKAASSEGKSSSMVFPMWQAADGLADSLVELTSCFAGDLHDLAVTMTGELADCFGTRSEGVSEILRHVEAAFPKQNVWVYRVDGGWSRPSEAKLDPWSVAASNWHAAAQFFAGELESGTLGDDLLAKAYERKQHQAILVDIGSTTVDVIPLAGGRVVTNSRTDGDRLIQQELVYTGLERTPIATLVDVFRVESVRIPVMRERFADISDAHLLLGLMDEEPENCDTADRRPRTVEFAHARLARMVGEDCTTLSKSSAREMAEQSVHAQLNLICDAIASVGTLQFGGCENAFLLFSGHAGEFAKRITDRLGEQVEFADISALLGGELSRCAPAYAVACLCRELQE